MPRQKLSEFRAKNILAKALGQTYAGLSLDAQGSLDEQLTELSDLAEPYVVKVDEGVKGRFKRGLVLLDVKPEGIRDAIQRLQAKGYRWLLIEPMVQHDSGTERYLSVTRDRQGLLVRYTSAGGVDVESHQDSIQSRRLKDGSAIEELAQTTGLEVEIMHKLTGLFEQEYFVFLEINPYIVGGQGMQILDAAVEVDDAGGFFVNDWADADFRRPAKDITPEEKTVMELDTKSPASFKLDLLEPNGSIFLLLSGGGASVLIADEIYNQGFGKQLANYGEYSGNPNTEETYIYTKAVLQLLLNSSAPHKILFIGGAVANFTDIAKTFAGVIQAIDEVAGRLKEQGIKIFVRRGGPNQETGLANLEAVLSKHGLLGAVHDPGTTLTAAVTEALGEVGHE
jgi:ATP-citrate lyase beta-subunit